MKSRSLASAVYVAKWRRVDWIALMFLRNEVIDHLEKAKRGLKLFFSIRMEKYSETI